ncbi:MAG TPA: 5-(carboxyamino)imidazole ribonucleotide synthase [Xanthobacteraceae bacterium]|nr:5-(carboxyamino)imidazole ribonucleotide synthase [Xanthobacteraceae bacterium]
MTRHVPALGPDATIGILGGGQLGRMLALAAAKLGLRCHVFAQSPDSPAFDVVHRVSNHDYTDTEALDRFAADVDVITYEFENIPAETATFLSARKPVLPDPRVLATTQDRLQEKEFVTRLGIATAGYAAVDGASALLPALDAIGRPAVLKTRRFGYDGKGQILIRDTVDPEAAWREIGGQPAILETFVPFEKEISVVAARGRDGAVVCFDVTENEHADHILKTSRVPAAVSPQVAAEATAIAERIAAAFDYVGVLAVEMFVLGDTNGPAVLVNEIAPRVHNSGHWTLDGASASQFEQHIRAIAGWPLARPVRYGDVEMVNLLGSEIDAYARWLATPGTSVHLYGKTATRPGRKMGHVTRVIPNGRPGSPRR